MIRRLRASSVCSQVVKIALCHEAGPVVLVSLKPLLGPAAAAITVIVACPGVVAAADER